jgi:NhaA family Na+:H+ antiporter
LNKLKCMRWELYVCLAGPFCWFGLLLCSLHPALALAFVVPFMPSTDESHAGSAHSKTDDHGTKDDEEDEGDDDDGEEGHPVALINHAPLHAFEHQLKWFVDCVVLFLFGLTNAGVQLNGIGALTLTIMASLVVGKTLGIGLFTLFAVKVLGIPLPRGMAMTDVWLLGFIAAIGLTVALFVAGEAFRNQDQLRAEAKMGALLSVFVGFVAVVIGKTCGGTLITKLGSGAGEDGEGEEEGRISSDEEDDDDDDEELGRLTRFFGGFIWVLFA